MNSRREIWRHPLPYLEERPLTALICRSLLTLARGRVLEVRGIEHIAPERDPFLFVANHNQRLEAVLLPTLLIYHRGGKLVHFLADWPYHLVPFVALLYRRSGVITVTHKDARPRIFNVFKPLFADPVPAFERALRRLDAGAPVGLFPESTMNRHPRRLLRGRVGAARLALRSGVPVVPAGIRFPDHDPTHPIPDTAPMVVDIRPPLTPPRPADPSRPGREEVRRFHHRVMEALAEASGKEWSPRAPRRRIARRNYVPERPTERQEG